MKLTPRHPVYAIIPSSLPSIESRRLILRPITEANLPALLAIRSRPEVAKHNHPKEPFRSIEETREWLATKTFTKGSSEAIGHSFAFSIMDKSISKTQEQVIGYVCINNLQPGPELGYSLLPEVWGRGYVTEALQMMLMIWWDLPRRIPSCDSSQEMERLYAICERGNLGSRHVLEKCGFEVVRRVDYETDELFVLEFDTANQWSMWGEKHGVLVYLDILYYPRL